MKHKLFFLLLPLLFSGISCNTTKNKGAQTLSVPTNVQIFNLVGAVPNDDYMKNISALPFKIYTSINAYCGCCVDDIKECNRLSSELKGFKNVAVLPICYSHDNFELLKFLADSGKLANISLPLILDSADEFRKKNAGLIDSKGRLTVLTDSDNRILAIGDPYQNKEDKNTFLSFTKNMGSSD